MTRQGYSLTTIERLTGISIPLLATILQASSDNTATDDITTALLRQVPYSRTLTARVTPHGAPRSSQPSRRSVSFQQIENIISTHQASRLSVVPTGDRL